MPSVTFGKRQIYINAALKRYIEANGYKYAEFWYSDDFSYIQIVLLKEPTLDAYKIVFRNDPSRGQFAYIVAKHFSNEVMKRYGKRPRKVKVEDNIVHVFMR